MALMLLTERILSFIAPHECLVCSREGTLLCDLCAEAEVQTVPSRCYRCLSVSRDSATCQKCRRNSALKHVWVVSDYADYAKELVRRFKFERAKAAHVPIARQIATTLPYMPPQTIVVHIPTATGRQRLRGYDQAELIAKSVAAIKKIEHKTLLARHGQSRQVGSTKKQRQRQISNAFQARIPDAVAGAHILLIDDILTTGATLESAAKVLKATGAAQVDAAVFAQKH